MSARKIASHRALYLFTAAGLALAGVAQNAIADDRGLKDPGPDVHVWLGTGTTNWQTHSNWNVGFAPGFDDTAIINGGLTNVSLTGDSAVLSSLFVSGGVDLYTNSNVLDVTATLGTSNITGNSTRLVVSNVTGGVAGFRTETLNINSGGRLQLTSGRTRVTDRLIMDSGATIYGHGLVEIVSNHPAAFSGLNGGAITANNGDLSVVVVGTGGIALPAQLNFNTSNATMEIDGPLINSARDVNMVDGSNLLITHPWGLAGTLTANGVNMSIEEDINNPITVNPTGIVSVTSGDLTINPMVNFVSGSNVSVSSNALLTIAGNGSDAQSGSQFSLVNGSTLRIEGAQPIGDFWSGDIDLNISHLEIAQPGTFRVNGDITLLSFLGLRSRIEGPGTLHLTGNLVVPGGGGIIANTLELGPSGLIELSNANTVLRVEGSLLHNVATSIIGAGTVQIDNGGAYRYTQPATLLTDINNAGTVLIRGAFSPTTTAEWTVDYQQGPTGTLHLKVAGTNSDQYDRVETSGIATLAGRVEVELVDGYMPQVGDSFEIMEVSGGIVGGFSEVVGVPGFEISTIGNSVLMSYVGVPECIADFTNDGVLNFFDVSAFLSAFGASDPIADLNHDGVLNFFDVSVFLNAFSLGCP